MLFPDTWSDYLDDLELDADDEGPPVKYGCRGRIGRGGRLVIDRYPVCQKYISDYSINYF